MEEPTEEDCCHSDCLNCVFDVYRKQQLNRARAQVTGPNALSTIRYKPFKLVSVVTDSVDVNVYRFRSEEGGPLHFQPGEHVVLRNEPSPLEPPVSREYTLLPSADPSTFSVLIKIYPNGQMSRYIKRWTVGHVAHWRGPYGKFAYKPNTFKKLIMLSIGTGIAPMFTIAKHILDDEKDETTILLLYGNRTPNDIALRADISQLGGYWNFKCIHYLSRETGQKKFGETFVSGRLSATAALDHVDVPQKDCQILICGSEEFSTTMQGSLMSSGFPNSSLFVF